MGGLNIGDAVVFFMAIASQGVDVKAEGVIVSPHGEHLILPDEFKNSDGSLIDAEYVHVRVFGKVLMVPDFVFTEPVVAEVENADSTSGDGQIANAQQSSAGVDEQGTSNGEGSNASTVDASADASGANSQPIKQSDVTEVLGATDSGGGVGAGTGDSSVGAGAADGGVDGANTANGENDGTSNVQSSTGGAVTDNSVANAGESYLVTRLLERVEKLENFAKAISFAQYQIS